jgi:predicted rRNA methylase YqxC with S4 and FtsJ domains
MTRLDQLLVERGLCESREKAKRLILAGQVRVNGQPARKPGDRVKPADELAVAAPEKFVSRGGHKLERALEHFRLDVAGLTAIDLGASTGGFTDCLLQHGAARVFAVDVGQGQLAWKLRQDPRVVVMEKTNARYLTSRDFSGGDLPASQKDHPSPSIPPHEPGKHSTFNIQRSTPKAGAQRSALEVQSWALNVECSKAQSANASGSPLPIKGREKDQEARDNNPATTKEQPVVEASPSPLNGERAGVRGGHVAQPPSPANDAAPPADLIVVDCSFISLKKILPPAVPLLRPGGRIVALIKPQFEAGKAEADKGRGVITDPAVHDRVLAELREFVAAQAGLCWHGVVESPLLGPAGNKEFLALIEKVR